MPYKTYQDLVGEAKQRIREVTSPELLEELRGGRRPVVIDVREPNEWNLGRLPGAVHIPRGQLEGHIEGRARRDQPVVLYCASGSRSALAADVLQQMGFEDVRSLADGFRGWVYAGGEVEG
jgi:rhodanese-related sulfurtransferase